MNDEAYQADSLGELSGELQVAVERLKRRPIPEAAMQKALDRAARCGSPLRWTDHRLRLKAVLGFVATIAACIAIAAWFLRPSDSWADVVKAVQAKPWIHLTFRGAKPDQFRETWISTSRACAGMRSAEQISFYDERLGIIDRYNSQEKLLYRLPIPGMELAQRDQFLTLLQGMFRGDAELKAGFSGMILKDQQRRQTEKDGRAWNEYELRFQIPSGSNSELRMTFLVDLQTRLPQSMTMKGASGELIESTIDYPDEGPADIYALGVPRDAKLDDRVPKGDMVRILAAMEAGRARFDDFHAIVIRSSLPDKLTGPGQAIPMAYLVWKKGAQLRVEIGIAMPQFLRDQGDPNKDLKQRVRDACQHSAFSTTYVCDGKLLYEGDIRSEGGGRGNYKVLGTADQADSRCSEVMPALWCFPRTLNPPNDRTEEIVNLKPSEGPPNTILVTSRVTHPRPNEIPFELFWLDPMRGYAVVRNDLRNTDPAEPPTDRDYQELMDQWEQTPSGIWYPTRVGTGLRLNELKTGGRWYHFFLDFRADMPDELFKPAKRTVLTDRYPVDY